MNLFHMMSEHANPAVSATINKIGYASIAAGGANAVATKATETQDPTWLTTSEIAGIVSIIASIVFIVKLCVDMYYTRKKDKREENASD